MFVPNFKILSAVVPEKSLTKKKVYTQTHRQTLLRKRRKQYTPHTSYAGGIIKGMISMRMLSYTIQLAVGLGTGKNKVPYHGIPRYLAEYRGTYSGIHQQY